MKQKTITTAKLIIEACWCWITTSSK